MERNIKKKKKTKLFIGFSYDFFFLYKTVFIIYIPFNQKWNKALSIFYSNRLHLG